MVVCERLLRLTERKVFSNFVGLVNPPMDEAIMSINWNAKVGSQEIPGVTDKFGLAVQNESGKG